MSAAPRARASPPARVRRRRLLLAPGLGRRPTACAWRPKSLLVATAGTTGVLDLGCFPHGCGAMVFDTPEERAASAHGTRSSRRGDRLGCGSWREPARRSRPRRSRVLGRVRRAGGSPGGPDGCAVTVDPFLRCGARGAGARHPGLDRARTHRPRGKRPRAAARCRPATAQDEWPRGGARRSGALASRGPVALAFSAWTAGSSSHRARASA